MPADIFSSKKHSMDYVTVDGVVQRTGYANKTEWYLLLIKEALDNAIDSQWEKYPGFSGALVSVEITLSDSLFHIKVRNTNPDNIPAFPNLSAIFNYEMTYGSKQNRHTISRGLLGDATKQIGTWPYVLMHAEDNGRAFTNKQWEKPLIIRANKTERHVFPFIDKANQRIDAKISLISDNLPHTDTEIETTWPIIDEVRDTLDIHKIERFCRQSIIFTTDISFRFRLIDNSTCKIDHSSNNSKGKRLNNKDKEDFLSELANSITNPAPKAAIEIDAPALHSISSSWNNRSSIHSFNPEEFVAVFTTIHDKTTTTVYDVLRRFKEGTQTPKTDDTKITVAQLMEDKHRDKKIEALFCRLHKVLSPSERLSLPYSHVKPEERKNALIDRVMPLYPKDHLDTKKTVYRLVHGSYKDDTYSTLAVQYPFAFEIIAIPLNDKILKRDTNRPSEFIGAVNYSVSPRSNRFEGDYNWGDKKLYYTRYARDIQGILNECGFEFGEFSGPRVRLPCVIAANLVSPRIDYRGKSKSDIDTQPFSAVIINAVTKVATEIQTFRAAGYDFYTDRELRAFTKPKKQAVTVEDVLEEVLNVRKEEAGL
jgi:hypothetical protein